MNKEQKSSSNPMISVVVPVFNVAPYLERCINSIINQTYRNLEIILVDDGSSDGSSEICDMFERNDSRICVIHKENGGLVSARKAGIARAKGKYAAYVDSDDWIERDMYDYLITHMLQNDADIVTSGVYRDYPGNTVCEFDHFQEGVYDLEKIKAEILPAFMYTGNFYEAGINIHIYNKLFKCELLLKHQLEVDDAINVGEDAAVVYPCILSANKVVILNKSFYHYCIRNNSIMAGGYRSELAGYRCIYKIIRKQIEEYKDQKMNLMRQLNYLMIYMLLLKEPQMIIGINTEGTLMPYNNVKAGERLVLYGGGKFGSTLHRFIEEEKLCEIVSWIDRAENISKGVESSIKLNDMAKESYDKIVIAVLVKTVADQIQEELTAKGIEKDKMARINVTDKEITGRGEWKALFGE